MGTGWGQSSSGRTGLGVGDLRLASESPMHHLGQLLAARRQPGPPEFLMNINEWRRAKKLISLILRWALQ